MVHTCPRCELRFALDAELRQHLESDHHLDVSEFERYRYQPRTSRPSGRRYLVVANRTLSSDALFERIRELAAAGGHFHIVAPATHSQGHMDATDEDGIALAKRRLESFVDRLHAAGIDAEGEVGHPEPARAVAAALQHQPADEILVSTLPSGLSRWLDVDLPAALQHRFGLPVATIN